MNNPLKSTSSLGNTLKLLNLFNIKEPELSLTELADKMEVAQSTIHRMAATLIQEGFLARDPVTKKFRLSSSLLSLEKVILSNYKICSFSTPILEKLIETTGEVAHLATIKEQKLVYLQKMDSINYTYLFTHEGKQNPLHATGTGQAILAYQTQDEIMKVIQDGLPAYTKNTITKPEQLLEALSKVKKMGYAHCREEFRQGITSLAAPVKGPSGKVNYSISIVGPTSRFSSHRLPELIKSVKEAAAELEIYALQNTMSR